MAAPLFTVQVRDLADRQHQIAEKCDANPPTMKFYDFPGGVVDLPLVELDIKIPVYRMENYRTKIRQLAYIKQNNLPPTFFSSGQEDQEAQRAQHKILVAFAESGKGDSVIPIKTALEKDCEQTEPLLLTREAVVVNGNRRLAAMRELYSEPESERFERFCSIRAMVLPPGVTSDELRRIEVRLQMQPLTLLPYDWVAEALAVRDLRERDFSNAEIASLMRLEKTNEVDAILDRLAEAEIYLSDYLGRSDAYDEVIDQRQQFFELQKAIKNKTAEAKEISRRICHVLTKNSRGLGKQAYQYKAAYGSKTDLVLERLADELGVDVEVNDSESATDGDDLDVFAGGVAVDPASRFEPLKQILSDTERSTELAAKIGDICDDIKELEADRNAGEAALRHAVRANTILAEISIDTADPATLPSVKAQLESVVSRAASLVTEVDGQTNS